MDKNRPSSAGTRVQSRHTSSVPGPGSFHMLSSIQACVTTTGACTVTAKAHSAENLSPATREATSGRHPHTAAGEQPLLSATGEGLPAAAKSQHNQNYSSVYMSKKKRWQHRGILHPPPPTDRLNLQLHVNNFVFL